MTPLVRLFLPLLFCTNLAAQAPRYALVVGNGTYANASLGQTPISDANAMRDALTLAGFEVDYFTDLDYGKLSTAIAAFGRKIKGSKGVALFYYSGHGVQHKNQNYLVPIGAELSDEEDIEGACIPINRITAKMQGANTSINLLMLDACRAFPLGRTDKNLTQGLTKEEYAVPELLVAYATAPGSTATLRGEGGLSLYTSQLLKHLKTPGLVLENVLKNTRRDVLAKSNNQQRPDETGNLTSDFYFFPATAQPDPTKPGPNAKEVPPATNLPVKTSQGPNASPGETGAKGASDRDLDGTPDDKDPCPDDYGTPAANGCPDYDEDGVPNSVDKCPNLPGKKDWQGCPDSDGDGLPDHEDLCPTEKGARADKGCPPPDADRDGIADALDACPNEYGLSTLQGCPDSDSDGVADKSDKCPTLRGLPKYQGCPDTDGDGVPDHEDGCPTVKGSAAAKGCPDLSQYGYRPDDFVRVAGSNTVGDVAWYSSNSSSKTHPVGQKAANELGIYDMSGNVWEWCSDWYDEKYYEGFRNKTAQNPQGPSTGQYAVLRGGSWYDLDNYCRSADRYRYYRDSSNGSWGWRVARAGLAGGR